MITRSSLGGTEIPRVLVLDGIRGLAILLVMMSHFSGFAFGIFGRERNGFDAFVEEVAGIGWMGVDLFFVLSGFLITGILLDTKASDAYLKRFYVRRILRIFPLFYGFLLFIVFIAPEIELLERTAQPQAIRDEAFWYFSYLLNIGWTLEAFSVTSPLVHLHFWSLAVEEQFYLVWPFAVLFLSRRGLTTLCVALLPLCLALRLFLASDSASDLFNVNASHAFTPARIDTLALGALLAIAVRSPAGLKPLVRYTPYAMAGGAVITAVLFTTSDRLSPLNSEVQTLGFTAIGLMFAGLVVRTIDASDRSLLHRTFAHPVLRFFGRYAYGLYVMHVLILFIIADQLRHHEWMRDIYLRTVFGSQLPASLLLSLTACLVSIVVAWLSWHLFEKQVLKLKAFFPYGTQPADRAPAPSQPLHTLPEPSPVMPPGTQ